MSAQNDVFWDYCKAENSEDEENNIDLQSRLYAEIYHAPCENDEIDIKDVPILQDPTLDTKTVDSNGSHKSTNCNRVSNFGDNLSKNNFDNSGVESSWNIHNSEVIAEDTKPNVELANSEQQTINTCTETRTTEKCNKQNKMLKEHLYSDNSEDITIKHSVTCHEITDSKVIPNVSNDSAVNENLPVKVETEGQSEEEVNNILNANSQTVDTVTHKSACLPINKSNDNNVEQKTIEEKVDNNTDILKKYEFSKKFINNLYLTKFQELEKKLETDVTNVNTSIVTVSEDETEMDTKYKVLEKEEKRKKSVGYYSEVTVISESETDSEESILEVPIPPKPQPPVINVQDSDEDSVTVSSDSDENDDDLCVITNNDTVSNKQSNWSQTNTEEKHIKENNKVLDKPNEKESCKNKKTTVFNNDPVLISEEEEEDTAVNDHRCRGYNIQEEEEEEEDIVLNCTGVQKGATSIDEIKEMSKDAQLKQSCSIEKVTSRVVDLKNTVEDTSISKKNKLTPLNQTCNKKIKKQEAHKHTTEIEPCITNFNENCNMHKSLPLVEAVDKGNSVPERDKNNVMFTKDIPQTSSCAPDNVHPSRKRRSENYDDMGKSPKQKKCVRNENNVEITKIQQSTSKQKSKEHLWREYFFRPMSEKLKAFYSESRGQENFDINEMQSKMSKDPRLWAILDEDLMPCPSRRQRFFNLRCNRCHRDGHQRYNCPEPRRPPRCHMCGTEGHTETRCPKKMCLTCGKQQGTFRKTCESCRTLYCNMCRAVGHNSTECPDLWRRFHQTTRNSEINIPDNLAEVMKPADLLFCCNCTKRGHDSSTCNEYRWSQHFPTPAFVSNYVDGPGYIDTEHAISKAANVIPLSKSKKRKRASLDAPANSETPKLKVLYSYGKHGKTFKTVTKTISNKQKSYHLAALLDGRVAPHFLEKLYERIKFHVVIYRTAQEDVTLQIKAQHFAAYTLKNIIMVWLHLEDDEKDSAICVDLPHDQKVLVKVLREQLDKLQRETDLNSDDPRYLLKRITQIKKAMVGVKDAAVLCSARDQLHHYQRKLVCLYNTKPTTSRAVNKLEKHVKLLENDPSKIVDPSAYLTIVQLYHKVFMPYTPSEIHYYLKSYYKNQDKQKKSKTSDKKQLSPYEKFITSLKKSNESQNIQKGKQKSTTASNTCTQSSKVSTQAQQESDISQHYGESSTSTFRFNFDKNYDTNIQKTSSQNVPMTDTKQCTGNTLYVENLSYTENAAYNVNIPHTKPSPYTGNEQFADDIQCNEISQFVDSVARSSRAYPIETVQVLCNKDIPNNTNSDIAQGSSKTISSNLIPITPVEEQVSGITAPKSTRSNEEQASRCPEKKTIEANSNSHKITATTNTKEYGKVEQIEATTNKKKKKLKKHKKDKQKIANVVGIDTNHSTNSNTHLINSAKKVINNAVSFQLPYMIKAAEEVRKRLIDKSIEQKHIDVLQKLVDLENNHQKRVNSVCSYLK